MTLYELLAGTVQQNLKAKTMSNKYSLKWNSHHEETFQTFDYLRQRDMFVDVTLSCYGQFLKAHKLVLCAGSGYFERAFSKDGPGVPIIHFYGVEIHLLKLLLEFMYCGEVEVPAQDLEKFIELAENLEVKGLKGDKSKGNLSQSLGGNPMPISDVQDPLAQKRKSTMPVYQDLNEQLLQPPKVPRAQPPMPRGRQQYMGPHSQQPKPLSVCVAWGCDVLFLR